MYIPEIVFSGTAPVMSCNRCGTGSVLEETNGQTVISKAAKLSGHPVRQICIVVLHRPTSQWLIKVDGLQIKIQKQVLRTDLSASARFHFNNIRKFNIK